MNCLEFTKRLNENDGRQESPVTLDTALGEHAESCSICRNRLETERSLTQGLRMLATDDLEVAAPSSLRSGLLDAFEDHFGAPVSNVVDFPNRPKRNRWALAVAASLALGFVLLFARWAPVMESSESAQAVVHAVSFQPGEVAINRGDKLISTWQPEVAVDSGPVRRTRRSTNSREKPYPVNTEETSTQVASTEVKSQFVPLTYLNDATAMDSGIVVRVEIARDQLATLGLPFDLERADDIIKADIMLGDDGVARAIRLVQ